MSFDEANSVDFTSAPHFDVHTPVSNHPTLWCLECQNKVYRDVRFLNDKGVITRTLRVERRVLTGSIPMMLDIHDLFTRPQLDLLARSRGFYIEKVVREFYASYKETFSASLDRRVDIFFPTIRQFLYGSNNDTIRSTPHHQVLVPVKVVKGGLF